MTRTARLQLGLVIACLCVAQAATAQQYGQWTWDASVGAVRRQYESTRDGSPVDDWTRDSLALHLGVDGYILSPAIAAFRASVRGLIDNSEVVDQNRVGYAARLKLLPQSVVPVEVGFAHDTYDQTRTDGGESPDFYGVPDTLTTAFGRVRFRSGPLQGTLIGFDRSDLKFIEGDSQSVEREFVDWSRSTRPGRHHVRLDRRYWDYGRTGYAFDDLTLTATEQYRLSDRWTWDLSGAAVERTSITEGPSSDSTTTTARISSNIVRADPNGRSLSVFYDGGYAGGEMSSSLTNRLGARYRIPVGVVTWEPFAAVGFQNGDDLDATIPEVGVAASTTRRLGSTVMFLTGNVSYIDVDLRTEEASGRSSTFGYGGVVSLSHGEDRRLSKQFELSYRVNQFSSAGDPIGDLPDLGEGVFGSGFDDSVAARLTLGHRWNGSRLTGWTEWRATKTVPFEGISYDISSLTWTLQYTSGRMSASANGGFTELVNGERQSIDTVGAGVMISLLKGLRLRGNYRLDQRAITDAPDRDAERVEAGLEFNLGLLLFSVDYFVANEVSENGQRFENSGVTATIRRDFRGLLPFVSGPERRGEVR